ncbi:TetR/AcrR family transcriptional regulator [Actinomadura livida]|uniref:AcrR family transcriptional regulator n=1 Tax=Actinomadura livida TaxID=79909 RepID=A0A7W7IA21_9ACTN|nr:MULTISPECIES: TetR/AcrR family transcriptional regulator [Actinomadura]MBB4772893.1 AcrR family transcriptional regulator [Actinomadura catellatispora]GGU13478.1 TetR family transcriptional regulator [Actinomadura livida]
METTARAPMSGRKAQAARNDTLIREAARAVFTADPDAPISAVAEQAGVGISALYRRYKSKEDLLQKLADEGMDRYLAQVEAALADERDAWEAFAGFMRRCLDIGAGSLTMRLAGSFEVTEEMSRKGREIHLATTRLLERAKEAGALRPEIEVGDVSVILEHLHGIRIGDDERMNRLQHRYLALILDALRLTDAEKLPGPAPTWQELRGRYDD